MTRKEAIAIIRKEYLCVDRDCDIERSCGKCDLMMPTKEPILEAFKMAMNSLEIDERYELEYEQIEPCDDAISRQAVLEAIEDDNRNGHYSCFASNNDAQCFKDVIRSLPPVTPQQKTGHWIDDKCSVCGKGIEDLIESHEWYTNEEPNFCPFCGCGLKLVEPQEKVESEAQE